MSCLLFSSSVSLQLSVHFPSVHSEQLSQESGLKFLQVQFLAEVQQGLQQVSGHSGLWGHQWMLFRADDMRVVTLVGGNKCGNKYYEDKKQFFGLRGWVIHTPEKHGKHSLWCGWSMVPPEWYYWLHCITAAPLYMTVQMNLQLANSFGQTANSTWVAFQNNMYLVPPLERIFNSGSPLQHLTRQ